MESPVIKLAKLHTTHNFMIPLGAGFLCARGCALHDARGCIPFHQIGIKFQMATAPPIARKD
eukprot:scaffold71075_cov21-Tisochrysis_lutea.AAC.2